jgi:glycerol-3-phosphate dehydrogenase (NAD(P)+)
MPKTIAVVGGGSWGTSLSIHLSKAGYHVKMWILEKELCEEIKKKRENPIFLKGCPIPEAVYPTTSLLDALNDTEIIFFAVPSEYSRNIFLQMREALSGKCRLVIATKGIEKDSLQLMTEVADEILGKDHLLDIAVLSGPSFAIEVAKGDPTAVVIASARHGFAEEVQQRFSYQNFRFYTNDDIRGVQIAGALKNVVAIAAGIGEGLGFGNNTLAALVTRGMSEMRRLGIQMGGKPVTFSGLAGIGDLVLTCMGKLSRNKMVGLYLGKGMPLAEILADMKMVAEGVVTAISALKLSKKHRVDMPIVAQVHSILYEGKSPREAISDLLSRPLKEED